MPITPNDMTMDAKMQHHVIIIDRSAAATLVEGGGGLHHADRDMQIVKAYSEVLEAHASTIGVYTMGKYTAAGATTDANFYMAALSIATSVAVGVFTEITLVKNLIAAGEVLRMGHTSSANAGIAAFHIFWHFTQNASNTQELI